jgi:hypothetical protein
LLGILKGIEVEPTQHNKLIESKRKDAKAKSIIGLTLSYLKLHHIDMEKSSKEI